MRLKLGIKNSTEVTLKSSRNVVEDTNHAINFPHQLLLTNAQVLMLHKALAMLHQLIRNYQELNCIK